MPLGNSSCLPVQSHRCLWFLLLPERFRGTRKPSPTHLLVQTCPPGHISSCPQLVHPHAAREPQLDLILAREKRVFLCTSSNELSVSSLTCSPSKYALNSSTRFPCTSLLRSKGNTLPVKEMEMEMESPSGVSGAACKGSSVLCAVRIAASSLSFRKQRSRCTQ